MERNWREILLNSLVEGESKEEIIFFLDNKISVRDIYNKQLLEIATIKDLFKEEVENTRNALYSKEQVLVNVTVTSRYDECFNVEQWQPKNSDLVWEIVGYAKGGILKKVFWDFCLKNAKTKGNRANIRICLANLIG